MTKWTLVSILALGMTSGAASPQDLSRYRDFRFGADLPTIAKQVGASRSQESVIHRRPALIQELNWRPQSLGVPSRAESAQEVVFRFCDGSLFQIAISYDRYQTEGLTADDFIEAISAAYGTAEKPAPPASAVEGANGDQDEIVARWQDSLYRFDLIRSSYGPSYRLIGVSKRLEASAERAEAEAKRLDDQEAPQREAARMADEKAAERSKLEKSRLENKPKFRP